MIYEKIYFSTTPSHVFLSSTLSLSVDISFELQARYRISDQKLLTQQRCSDVLSFALNNANNKTHCLLTDKLIG